MADTGIGIHTDNKNFALAACAFEIADVSNVQGVKATVGKYDASALAPVFGEFLAQHSSRDDFGSGLAHDLRSSSGCLATDGLEKFLARNGGGSPVPDPPASRHVGNWGGPQRWCSPWAGHRLGGQNRGARRGDGERL